MPKHFFKCWDCLEPFAIESDKRFTIHTKVSGVKCPFCGGNTFYMGKVEGVRLLTQETQCACDERCTNAVGPICDCKCHGANHGTHRVVEVTIDMGGVPQPKFVEREECVERAAEFIQALALAHKTFENRHAEIIKLVKANKWVKDYKAWRAMYEAQQALLKFKVLRTHKGRMKKIEEFLLKEGGINLEMAKAVAA